MMMVKHIVPALLIGCLSACGQQSDHNSATANAPTAADPEWNALDACTLVGKDRMAAALGQVDAVSLEGVTQGTAKTAAFSTCRFAMADGRTITVLTRKSPVTDATPGAIEQARTMGGNMPPATDVPGLGKAALWTSRSKILQIFLDDTRYATIMIIGPAGKSDTLSDARKVAVLLSCA